MRSEAQFLTLPLELRDMVYLHALAGHAHILERIYVNTYGLTIGQGGMFKCLCMDDDDLCDKDNDLDIRYTKDHLNQSCVTSPQAYGERSAELVKAANCVFYMNRFLPCHLCKRNTHTRYLLPLLYRHYWCRGCVEFGMLQSIQITSEDCLPGCCGLDIPPPLGQRLLSQELARASERRFLQFKTPQAEWQRCPDPSCNAYIHPQRIVRAIGQVDCDTCRTRVCPRCRKRCWERSHH